MPPISAGPALRTLAESSIALINAHQHPGGAYPASPDYAVYGYSWLRDGSFIADAMSRAGQPQSADAFHGWCARVICARVDRIHDLVGRSRRNEPIAPADMLPTRYTLEGGDGEEPWWDYQLDGYGTWLWAVVAHAQRHGRSLGPYRSAIEATAEYLATFGGDACYDWWEEHAQERHVATLGSVVAGLRAVLGADLLPTEAAARAAERLVRCEKLIEDEGTDGHLTKWLGSASVDGSLLACLTPFRIVQPHSQVAESTYAKVLDDLLRGGVYRYIGDTFYGGGEWLILTAWLGWHEARTGRTELAWQRLHWIAGQATSDGLLPEQVSGNVQDPGRIAEWTQRWGPVATPLLWSHAMFLTLATELGVL